MTDYRKATKLFKTLSNPIRLKILDMLSCGEMCACDILEGLTVSQSTLSHHMKVLIGCNLVVGRKESTWMYYSIDQDQVRDLHAVIDMISKPKEPCICNKSRHGGIA